MFGVSPKKKYGSRKFNGPSTHEQVWGIGKYGHNIYPNVGQSSHDKQHNQQDRKIFYSSDMPYDVDILLDVDKGELSICLVNQKEMEFKLWNMPLLTSHGWIPHLSTEGSSNKTMLRIAQIHPHLYAENMDYLFQ